MTVFSRASGWFALKFQGVVLFLLTVSAGSLASAQSCVGHPVAVQILGSGGPWIKADRASTSYLVWVDEQAKILVDMGGGAFLRFGQSQAKLSDLAMIAISHLHPDHVSDLPALLWLSQQIRHEPLPISGPSGNDQAPEFGIFLRRLFDEKNGAFPLLSSTLSGGQGRPGPGVRLNVTVVDAAKSEPTKVLDRAGIRVTALGIPHGGMPTLAYRVQTRGVSIVFSSDQTGTEPRFMAFAKGANVLIMHMTINAGASSALHASPLIVGQIARDASVGRLIVSHLGQFDLDPAIAEVRKSYTGPLTVGADLQCTPVQ
jgi:ribonuclease BN (tRNA processing enzyme)